MNFADFMDDSEVDSVLSDMLNEYDHIRTEINAELAVTRKSTRSWKTTYTVISNNDTMLWKYTQVKSKRKT